MKGIDFVFDIIDLMHYKCHKISLNCSGSYIDSKWLRKGIINPKNNYDDKIFKYAVVVTLNKRSWKSLEVIQKGYQMSNLL